MVKENFVAVCADDFGLSHGVSLGILQALAAGRLTAVSALTTGSCWPAMGRELLRRGVDADIGLHFNLTLGAPLGPMPNFAPKGVFPPLSKILRLSARGRLPLAEIREETHRQLDRFEAVMERSPDHFDGHQHVHVVGDIRETILDVLTERGLQGEIWLRDVSDTVPRVIMRKTAIGKALSLRTLARGFAKEAHLRGFTVNDGFSGLSNFDPAQNYADHFSRYLLGLGARHLIMCHPGHVDAALLALDSVTQTREQELEFLISPRFPELLQQKGLMLARLSQM